MQLKGGGTHPVHVGEAALPEQVAQQVARRAAAVRHQLVPVEAAALLVLQPLQLPAPRQAVQGLAIQGPGPSTVTLNIRVPENDEDYCPALHL